MPCLLREGADCASGFLHARRKRARALCQQRSPNLCACSRTQPFRDADAEPAHLVPAGKGDFPAWEDGKSGTGAIGMAEGLTWQPRRVLLFPEEEGENCTFCGAANKALVRRIIFDKGRSRSEEIGREWEDPHVLLDHSGNVPEPAKPPHPQKARWKYPAYWRKTFRLAFVGKEARPRRACTATGYGLGHQKGYSQQHHPWPLRSRGFILPKRSSCWRVKCSGPFLWACVGGSNGGADGSAFLA